MRPPPRTRTRSASSAAASPRNGRPAPPAPPRRAGSPLIGSTPRGWSSRAPTALPSRRSEPTMRRPRGSASGTGSSASPSMPARWSRSGRACGTTPDCACAISSRHRGRRRSTWPTPSAPGGTRPAMIGDLLHLRARSRDHGPLARQPPQQPAAAGRPFQVPHRLRQRRGRRLGRSGHVDGPERGRPLQRAL